MLLQTRLVVSMAIVGVLLAVSTDYFAQDRSANKSGCALVDKNHPAQFISYEGKAESSEIKLRLRNNTDCAIIVETDDTSRTQIKRLSNGAVRVEGASGSEDGATLRLHYLIQDRQRQKAPAPAYGWGDSVFSYQILAGQSVIFTVPASHFKQGLDIAVPFNYSWEGDSSIGMGAGGVVHRVYFLFDDIPQAALRERR